MNCNCEVLKTEYNDVPPVHPNCRCSVEDGEWFLAEDACPVCVKKSAEWVRRKNLTFKTLNTENMQVFGIASSTNVDLHDEFISEKTLERAAYRFVSDYRIGKLEHGGEPVATLIESMFITKAKAEMLGISQEYVNKLWIGFQIHDADVWQKVKTGELSAFSIGGKARTASPESKNDGGKL